MGHDEIALRPLRAAPGMVRPEGPAAHLRQDPIQPLPDGQAVRAGASWRVGEHELVEGGERRRHGALLDDEAIQHIVAVTPVDDPRDARAHRAVGEGVRAAD